MSPLVTIRVGLALLLVAFLVLYARPRSVYTVTVEASWERAPAAEVDARVTRVLVRELSRLEGARSLSTENAPGLSRVKIEVAGRSWWSFRSSLLPELERVRARLPAGVRPKVAFRTSRVFAVVEPLELASAEDLSNIAARVALAFERTPFVYDVRIESPSRRREITIEGPRNAGDLRSTGEVLETIRAGNAFTFPVEVLESIGLTDRVAIEEQELPHANSLRVIVAGTCQRFCETDLWSALAGADLPVPAQVLLGESSAARVGWHDPVQTIDRERIAAAGARESDVLRLLAAAEDGLLLGRTADLTPVIARIDSLEGATLRTANGVFPVQAFLGSIESPRETPDELDDLAVHRSDVGLSTLFRGAIALMGLGWIDRWVRTLRAPYAPARRYRL